MSYNELANMSNSFGRGLRLLGQAPGSKIAIYAETRAEWMMSCLGAFSQVRILYKCPVKKVNILDFLFFRIFMSVLSTPILEMMPLLML